MQQLLPLITQLLDDFYHLFAFLLQDVLLPILPLLGWILFWLFAVNWVRLRETLLNGAWIGLFLVGFVTIVTWSAIAPPAAGTHNILGLSVSNVVGKTVYVTMLFSIMFLCGAVQLSGCCGGLTAAGSSADQDGEQPAEA
ncbi:MAG: hypothetical protein ABGZ17_14195 [Planctomycetaceae bacterium]